MWIIVLFFLDLNGDGHFAVSKEAFTKTAPCEIEAQHVADDVLAKGAMEAWAQCMPVPGHAT